MSSTGIIRRNDFQLVQGVVLYCLLFLLMETRKNQNLLKTRYCFALYCFIFISVKNEKEKDINWRREAAKGRISCCDGILSKGGIIYS